MDGRFVSPQREEVIGRAVGARHQRFRARIDDFSVDGKRRIVSVGAGIGLLERNRAAADKPLRPHGADTHVHVERQRAVLGDDHGGDELLFLKDDSPVARHRHGLSCGVRQHDKGADRRLVRWHRHRPRGGNVAVGARRVVVRPVRRIGPARAVARARPHARHEN